MKPIEIKVYIFFFQLEMDNVKIITIKTPLQLETDSQLTIKNRNCKNFYMYKKDNVTLKNASYNLV